MSAVGGCFTATCPLGDVDCPLSGDRRLIMYYLYGKVNRGGLSVVSRRSVSRRVRYVRFHYTSTYFSHSRLVLCTFYGISLNLYDISVVAIPSPSLAHLRPRSIRVSSPSYLYNSYLVAPFVTAATTYTRLRSSRYEPRPPKYLASIFREVFPLLEIL